jgi:PPE-repeat protein
MNLNRYLKKIRTLTGVTLLFTALPLLFDLGSGEDGYFASAAYAKGGDGGGDDGGGDGDGDGSGGNSGSGSGNSGSGNSGSGNSGSGSSGSGNSGSGYSGQGGNGNSQSQAVPDIVVRHLNGWVEGVISGTYVVRDYKNRIVIKRSATPEDIKRLKRNNDR